MPSPVWSPSCSEITDGVVQQCAKLSWITWPKGDLLADRVARWATIIREPESDQRSETLFHLVFDGTRLLAMALSFRRVIACAGERFPILALASVISDPDERGNGYGRTVVEAALARHRESGLPYLFQTGVPSFYERLGAVRLTNPIMTSTGERAFWDPYAMRYPAGPEWPSGAIDLLGPGW